MGDARRLKDAQRQWLLIYLLAACFCLDVACGNRPFFGKQADTGSSRPFQLPTATEAFELRSKCAALGDALDENSPYGPALYESVASHYNPQSNRCYVELTRQTADLTNPDVYTSRSVYDGQTKELLAWTRFQKGLRTGEVLGKSLKEPFAEASEYMNDVMKDDRAE